MVGVAITAVELVVQRRYMLIIMNKGEKSLENAYRRVIGTTTAGV